MIDQIHDARRRTDHLFGIVKPEALYDRPIPERHRIIFYVGHLEGLCCIGESRIVREGVLVQRSH